VVKYAYIAEQLNRYSVVKLCSWLKVSRSGFYKWRDRKPSATVERKALMAEAVAETFERFQKRYGAPRITVELNQLGMACSENYVADILRIQGLKAKNGKNFNYIPSANAVNHVADNLLARNFSAQRPNEKWVSDITYLKVERGYVYLAVVMDLFSRRIVGWSLDTTMTNALIINALKMAVAGRAIKPGLILHSDRGVQYRSGEYQYLLHQLKIKPSMSRKGNCWDNAAMESFFARLKVESIYGETLKNKAEAYRTVFEYIEVFYNRVRRHSANGYLSPVDYENYFTKKQAF
jgi:transposase InsO family protein